MFTMIFAIVIGFLVGIAIGSVLERTFGVVGALLRLGPRETGRAIGRGIVKSLKSGF